MENIVGMLDDDEVEYLVVDEQLVFDDVDDDEIDVLVVLLIIDDEVDDIQHIEMVLDELDVNECLL